MNIPGIGSLDNDDFCVDTLTIVNVSHCTIVMFVQPKDLEVTVSDAERDVWPLPTSSEQLKLLCLEHVFQSYKAVEHGQPTPYSGIDIRCQITEVKRQRASMHALVHLADNQTNTPAAEQTNCLHLVGFRLLCNKM